MLIADNAAKIGNTQSMAFTIADYTHQIDDIDVPKASQYPLSMNLNSETAVICLFGNFWKLPMFGSQVTRLVPVHSTIVRVGPIQPIHHMWTLYRFSMYHISEIDLR